MQRRAIRMSLLVSLGSFTACGGDTTNTTAGQGDDGSAGDSGINLDTGGSAGSGGGSGGTADGTAGVDDTHGSDTGSATGGTSNTGGSDSGDDASGTGNDSGDDTGGGPTDPPPADPPGVKNGLCENVGEVVWCFSGAPQAYNVGVCHPGTQTCVPEDLDFGHWSACEDEQGPGVEVCDGFDNDCNGEVDDGFGVANCGLGACNHEEPVCVDGEPNECDPDDGATMETCNGIDDDCDGDIDDGLGDQVIECGVGQCEHTVTGCEDGELPECNPLEGATTETCDGIDNDCDGDTDEDIPDLHCGVGQCEHTVPGCIGGIPQVCNPYDGATTETCDGIDNDCDGLTDEDQGNWVCGAFDCQVTVPTCVNGQPQGPETCVPEPGGDEICGNGIDDNCDGEAPDCVESFLVGTDNAIRPVDIIWAVDSSGSMSEEMQNVEDNINAFASTLAAAGSSGHLHLISDRGTETFNICVTPPLGGAACADNPVQFYQYDTNGTAESMVHSSNALGRIMQQSPVWIPRLQANSHLAFLVTTDDDGDDGAWGAPQDDSSTDDCGNGYISDGTTGNNCRWDDPTSANNYTSLAYDWGAFLGFSTFMTNFFPGYDTGDDWTFYPIIGSTGTTVLTGANDVYEFSCNTAVETGDEYVKLALLTDTQDSMTAICAADWDLDALANDIVSNIPNDTYVLQGSPPGNCLLIDPTTITVLVNAIPLANTDWTYDAASCTVTVVNNIPVVGDTVVIVYENY